MILLGIFVCAILIVLAIISKSVVVGLICGAVGVLLLIACFVHEASGG